MKGIFFIRWTLTFFDGLVGGTLTVDTIGSLREY
jgi:hypothetical protein